MTLHSADSIVLDQIVNTSLVAGGEKLGASLEFDAVHIRGATTFAVSLRSILERAGRSVLDSDVLAEADAWIIYHNFSVSPHGRTKGPDMIGLEVEFDVSSQVVTTELFPQSKFVESITGTAELRCRAGVGLNGEGLSLPLTPTAGASANVVAELSFEVWTPEIVTSGRFSNRVEWLFYRAKCPLVGDFQVAHSVLVPKGLSEATFLQRLRAAIPGKIPGYPAAMVPSSWQRERVALRETDIARVSTLRIFST